MRRGFKAAAERHAADLRKAVDCSEYETIDLPRVARYLQVAVLAADKVLGSLEPLQTLHKEQEGAFRQRHSCFMDEPWSSTTQSTSTGVTLHLLKPNVMAAQEATLPTSVAISYLATKCEESRKSLGIRFLLVTSSRRPRPIGWLRACFYLVDCY